MGTKILQALKTKGYSVSPHGHLKPTPETLQKLGFDSMRHWARVVRGEKDLTASQLKPISDFFDIPLMDFVDNK